MNEEKKNPVDQNKVGLAVRFLKDDNVKNTDHDRKLNFLRSKGLTEEEIRTAEEHCKDAARQSTGWGFFDIAKYAVLGLGALSAANYAYKAYILPYVTNEVRDDQRLETLGESVQTLQDDIKQHTYELTATLKELRSLIEEQQETLKELNKKKSDSVEDKSVHDLKTELASVKSLLLSKTQFAPAPFTSNSKGIPAWQLASETVKEPQDKLTLNGEIVQEKNNDEVA